MGAELDLFVGRTAERALGERATARAFAGEGTVLLFYGEPGLGKTSLVQAVAKAAAQRGARVVWGRAWEAGGAPSYWPWIQIFRALGAREDPFRADELGGATELPQARFANFDRAARWLKNESMESALVLVLDDLHAADLSSLLFLHFLVRDKTPSRLLVLGTYRDVEARLAPDVEPLLAKIAREGEAVALARLSHDDVLEWICADSGQARQDAKARADADQVYATTEGNALFVRELLRVRSSTRTSADATRAAGLRAVLDEHLGRLTPTTRSLLEIASVLGRDLDPSLVAKLSGSALDAVDAAVREALHLGLVASVSGGENLSFSHMLLRERLYAELPPSRRSELHGAAGDAILASGGDPATATHHLLESSCPSARIAEVAHRAAKAALARLAFEESARLCARALAKHDVDDVLTTDLELLRAEALIRTGDLPSARALSVQAAERAKRLGLAERQAEAALIYGLEFVGGAVDPTMVGLLRTALAALPDEDSPIRARVLARLSSALVPVVKIEDREEVVRLSDAALAMARRVGDKETLLYALTFAGSASSYLLPSRSRAELTREHVALAKELGRPLVLLSVGGWWVTTLREQGAIAESEAALASFERILEDFPQPHYQFRSRVLRMTRAALSGDFETAERYCKEVRSFAGQLRQVNMVSGLLEISLAHLRGDPASIAPHAAAFEELSSKILGATGFRAWMFAATGQADKARAILDQLANVHFAFPWMAVGGEAACMLEDRELAERYYPMITEHAKSNSFFWGAYGSMAFGPLERVAGDLARFLGRADEARGWYEKAIAIGERMQAPAITALAERGLAALARRDGRPSVRTAARAGAASASASIEGITLTRDGETWVVTSSTGISMHLKDSKGLSYLSHLVGRPRQEVHVTDLADLSELSTDAGAILDPKAKAAYKARLESLREQVEEARRFGDAARADAAQAEIDTVADELARSVGLGGRDRKMGSQVEKVRINVQRRLRDAIQRIEEHDAALGRYLAATIKTGTFCMFSPI